MLLQTIAISDSGHWILSIPLLFVGRIPWAIYFEDEALIVWLKCRPRACRWTVVARKLSQGRCQCLSAENPEEVLWPSSLNFSKIQTAEASWIHCSLSWSRPFGRSPSPFGKTCSWRWNDHVSKGYQNLNILPVKNMVPYLQLSSSHPNIWPLYLSIPFSARIMKLDILFLCPYKYPYTIIKNMQITITFFFAKLQNLSSYSLLLEGIFWSVNHS